MSYNLHCHLHLPKQVLEYGLLNKCSCFSFENMFRISKDMIHGKKNYLLLLFIFNIISIGTRNYASQIAKNLTKRQLNKLALNSSK